MAKGIRERLLEQAGKFHQWQEITYPGKTTEEIGGAWEVDYPAWNDIFDAFCHVLTQMNAEMEDSILLDEMVYLIARANEAEGFIQETTSQRKDSITARWVKGDGFPKTEDNKAKNDFLATLTPEQKGIIAEMLQDEHIAGIHDTLAYINEMMDLEGLELHQDGESYPNDYFESLHYDFISRCDGDEWPE